MHTAPKQYYDAFDNCITLGDEVATITYTDNIAFRGVIIKLGKNQVKVWDNWRNGEPRWISTFRTIRTRTKEQLELDEA